jgi:hypothetical protein
VLIESMERDGHLWLDLVVGSALLDISAATIDRLLRVAGRPAAASVGSVLGRGSAIRQSVPAGDLR